LWLHSLKVAQLLRSAACLHTNQSRSYLNHLVLVVAVITVAVLVAAVAVHSALSIALTKHITTLRTQAVSALRSEGAATCDCSHAH